MTFVITLEEALVALFIGIIILVFCINLVIGIIHKQVDRFDRWWTNKRIARIQKRMVEKSRERVEKKQV